MDDLYAAARSVVPAASRTESAGIATQAAVVHGMLSASPGSEREAAVESDRAGLWVLLACAVML
jgi:hypothetical protein